MRLDMSRVQLPAVPLSCTDLEQVVTKQYNLVPVAGAAMSCDWEGNRRSGVALTMRHIQIQWFMHLRAPPSTFLYTVHMVVF